MKPLCIHHHPCADGFSAAWAVWKAFKGEVDFHPGVHGEPPPDVTGRHVIMVDFSYPKDTILKMAEQAASLLILDHHKTAEEALRGINPAPPWPVHLEVAERYRDCSPFNRVNARFDMNKSGCVLAWEFFHPGEAVPAFLLHMQDRDLWQFKFHDTRALT